MKDSIKKIIKDIEKNHMCKSVNMGVVVIPVFDWECFVMRLKKLNEDDKE